MRTFGLRQIRTILPLLLAVAQLAACGGGGRGSAPVPPPGGGGNDPPVGMAGSLQLAASALSIDEGGSAATLTITRTGGGSGAVAVTLTTTDGTANAGQDYIALNTTVSFAAGETDAKTVSLTIDDDAAGESDETFTVLLSAPTGGARLGATVSSVVTIHDDDAPLAPALTVSSGGLRKLRFDWASAPTTVSYRLSVDADGASGYAAIGPEHGADVTSASIDVAVHLHDWANARYRLEPCNARGCSASEPVSAAGAMLRSIGYLKADDTGSGDIGVEDRFGSAVAMSADGQVLAVGAPRDDDEDFMVPDAGSVYLFVREDNRWSLRDRVRGAGRNLDDQFGTSVALSGDGRTLVVGAPSSGIAQGPGVAHVYVRDGDQWNFDGTLRAPPEFSYPFARFGAAVAIAADSSRIIVGAPRDPAVNVDTSGAIFEFVRHPGPWRMRMRLWVHPPIEGAFFGSSVALSADGKTLFASAPFETVSLTERQLGAVYVYTLNATTQLWDSRVRLVGGNSEEFDNFGGQISVSSDGNTLAVSALAERGSGGGVAHPGPTPVDDDDTLPDAGAVYVFMREAGVWSQRAYIKPSNPGHSDMFGMALSLSADGRMLAVGGAGEGSRAAGVGGDESDDGAANSGAAYVFELSGGQWSQRAYVKAANPQSEDWFGVAVALNRDGSVLAVGAPLEDGGRIALDLVDNNDGTDAGAVYLY